MQQHRGGLAKQQLSASCCSSALFFYRVSSLKQPPLLPVSPSSLLFVTALFSTRRVYPFTFHFTFSSLAHQPSARPSDNTPPLSLSRPRTFDDSSRSLRTQGPFYTHIYTSSTQWLLHFFAAPSVLSSRPWPAAHEVTHPPILSLFFFYPGVLTCRQGKHSWSRYQDGGRNQMHEPWSLFTFGHETMEISGTPTHYFQRGRQGRHLSISDCSEYCAIKTCPTN